MAQHYMAVLSEPKPTDSSKLTTKRFTFFESRRAAKWHKEIALITSYWTIRPVNTDKSPIHGLLFPYPSTQLITKQYLGRTKTQEDDDRRLLELIKNHGCKEVALAACGSYLSTEAVKRFLETEFEASAGGIEVIESYLQAFVAAAYYKLCDFSLHDQTFATILVAVAGDTSASHAATLHMLISAWKAGTPTDETLRLRADSLTATVLHNAKLKLEHYRSTFSWSAAKEYRAPLLLLNEALETAGSIFEDCVNDCIPQWRCWAKWTPDAKTIDVLDQRLRTQYRTFSCLQELDGPDFAAEGGEIVTVAWRGLIRRQRLIPWLESKGFKIGVGLIVGDTESLLTDFVEQLRSVVDAAITEGPSAIRLLEMYVEREGLDSGTLTAWEDVQRVLVKPLPSIAAYIVDPKPHVESHEELDIVVGNALQALFPAGLHAVRKPVIAEIAQCVQLACNKLESDLRMCMPYLALEYEWLASALRLWRLREKLESSAWLHHAVDKSLVEASKSQAPTRDLQVLNELHVRVRTISSPVLLNAVEAYVHSFVLDGDVQTKQLARALHTLWTNAHDHATREAGITLATLENVRVHIRSRCIVALAVATGSAAEQLQDRLLQIKAKVTAAYVDLTDVIMSLSGALHMQVCWAELLWALFKLDTVIIDDRIFTDRGHKPYMQWIQQLVSLFSGKLTCSAEIHRWLEQLQGQLERVLQALEGMDDSKNVMHRLLTTTKPELCKLYDRILLKIDCECREPRQNFMLSLLLSLDGDNARAMWTAVDACSALSDTAFTRCQAFLTLARKNKDLAAARLAIWLNMSEYSPMLKAALIDVGAVLRLKQSDKAWSAAKTHFETKVQELVDRARKLENTRMALMRTSRSEVEKMMEDLKFEAPAGVSAIIAALPAELADVVEDVAEDQLEMHFSLGHLHSLTKLALGVQGTETVIVTLRVFGGGVVDAYCVHLEETAGTPPTMTHVWTEIQRGKPAPTEFGCTGKQTRLGMVVARSIWRELQTKESDVAKLYACVKATIQSGANECIVCATNIGARLHRATWCGSMVCKLKAGEVDFGTRTEMVRHDSRVLDLLLTAVYATANIQKLDLLPGMPPAWTNGTKLLALLNALPATETLAKAADMQTSLRFVGKHADLLVSWLCNASRTFIISATGHWRIPNMPGIHQFLVVDNPPEIEAGFAKHNHIQPRMVLFHGTSMDRLYAILTQGLRVLSNTPLMKHGAASGPGIYFSTETSLPASYAAGASKALGSPAFFKSRKDFDGPQVLLGCEHAGPANKGGVFVVTDPTKVVVRYIFLVPKGVAFPLAKDIVAPMVSTFYSLRASAAVRKED